MANNNKRQQVESPLAGATGISPTVQQRFIEPSFRGAARPLDAARTPLGRLGSALKDVAPHLGNILLQRSLTQADKARTVGELEAQKAGASATMEQINSQIKALADAGKISEGMIPAAIRGAEIRKAVLVARDRGFQKLYARFDDVARHDRKTEPEAIETEVYNELLKTLGGSVEVRAAFDGEFARIATAFKQAANSAAIEDQRAISAQTRAQRFTDLLNAFAAAPDTIGRAQTIQAIGAYIEGDTANGGYKTELARSKVATAVVADATPFIRTLVAEGDTEDALDLIETLEDYDLTGEGGMLGATREAGTMLANLRAEALNREPGGLAQRERDRREAEALANDSFRSDIVSLGGAPLTKQRADEFTAAFRAAHPDNPNAIFAFEKSMEKELAGDRAFSEPDVVIGIKQRLQQFDTAGAEAALEAAEATNAVSTLDAFELAREIRQTEELTGLLDPAIVGRTELDLYDSGEALLPGERQPTFKTGEQFVELLTTAQKREHRGLVMERFRETAARLFRETGDVTRARQEAPRIYRDARQAAHDYADKLTGDYIRLNREAEIQAQVKKRLGQMRNQQALFARLDNSAAIQAALKDLAGAASQADPKADFRSITTGRFSQLLTRHNPEKLRSYGLLKGLVGYTPAEIRRGKTAEGVRFDASALDPRSIPVFENLNQLETEWNNGTPAPNSLFVELLGTVGGGKSITAFDFYTYQKLLLQTQSKRTALINTDGN